MRTTLALPDQCSHMSLGGCISNRPHRRLHARGGQRRLKRGPENATEICCPPGADLPSSWGVLSSGVDAELQNNLHNYSSMPPVAKKPMLITRGPRVGAAEV